jgi:hypothetical protein
MTPTHPGTAGSSGPANGPAAAATRPIPPNGIDLGPGRRRVFQQDLDVFQALVGGGPPSVEVPGMAADDAHGHPDPADADVPPSVPLGARTLKPARRLTRVLILQLADCYTGVAARVGGPDWADLGSWVRRISRDARRKVVDAGARLAHRRPRVAKPVR